MGPVLDGWLRGAVRLAYECRTAVPLSAVRDRAVDHARAAVPCLNVREAAFLADAVLTLVRSERAWMRIHPGGDVGPQLTRPAFMEPMERAANQMDRRLQTKSKAMRLESQLSEGRASSVVFYLCSWHQTPAGAHRGLQGRLYVDRYWRSTLERNGYSFWVPAVEELIRRRAVMTVQEAVRAPYWLIFRPYCRHYLVPVDTMEVLGSSDDREVLMRHPEARMPTHRSMDYAARRAAYSRRRSEIAMDVMRTKSGQGR